MRRTCPQCQGNFDTQFLCPKCGVQLLEAPGQSPVQAAVVSQAPPIEEFQSAGVARQLIAGFIVAQGLYYSVRQMGIAWDIWVHGAEQPVNNQLMQVGLQSLAALLGGLVAGVGNPRGLVAGTAIGILNAFALLAAQFAAGTKSADFMVFGACLPLGVFGALGGWVGRHSWPSLADLPDPTKPKGDARKSKESDAPPDPLAWLRVLGGTALSVGCTVWAGAIRDAIIQFASGSFILESRLQAQFVAWAISALAMVFGGAVGGATSRGGLRQGFLVGLLASIAIFVIHQEIVKEVLPAEAFFVTVTGLPELDTPNPAQTAQFLLTNTLLLGTVGGFLGGTLFPRLAPATSKLGRGEI